MRQDQDNGLAACGAARTPSRERRQKGRRWYDALGMILLAAYFLFAHLGCHGDEDNELFTAVGAAIKAVARQ
jgi:hypothetical protein